MTTASVPDPFGTANIRARVLAGWGASAARFREDANAEEDLVLGGYRDRLVHELAQNAADAAARAGAAGRLLLRLDGDVLVAANTGAPLDAAGVEALATLRASAKRGEIETTGRFGVGFAAVLAVSDDPVVVSRSGGVRWSRHATRSLAEDLPALREELARRGDAVPVLRLPFPETDRRPPEGYTTAVVLPLRDEAAGALARRLLAGVDAALLLTLPTLAEVTTEVDGVVRTLRASSTGKGAVEVVDEGTVTRWVTASDGGSLEPSLLVDRPTEERARPYWSLTWAVPVDTAGRPAPLPETTPAVVHAPAPTDEPLGLPALLVASLPVEPSRRHVAPGPLRDFLLERAAEAYARLVAALPADPALLDLVPGPLAAGEMDGLLRAGVRDRLATTEILPPAAAGVPRLAAREAVAVEGAGEALVRHLADVLPGLLPATWARRRRPLDALGVRRLRLDEAVDALAGLRRPTGWWHDLYAAVSASDPDPDLLRALPVPLADGRVVTGARGALVPESGLDLEGLAGLGLRIVHPAAAHPLLVRLGALPTSPRALLGDPLLRAAVVGSVHADDPAVVAEPVLRLVARAGLEPGEEPWLAELALPDDRGDWVPAGELVLAGSPLADVLEPDALGRLDESWARRFDDAALQAVGVLRTFALVRDSEVALDPDSCDHDLDLEPDWVSDVRAGLPPSDLPPVLLDLVAVRDLDLVRPDRWEEALRLLAEPPLRDALTEPAYARLSDGRSVSLTPYGRWWLGRHPVLGGRRPGELRLPDADPLLHGLYDPAPALLDPPLLRALGVRSTAADLLAEPGGPEELLDRLADAARPVTRAQLRALLTWLAGVDPARVRPPARVRALVHGCPTVVPAADAVVVDAPDLLPLLVGRPVLLVPLPLATKVADLLDVALASEVVSGEVQTVGRTVAVPEAVRALAPGGPVAYEEHESLRVDGVEVEWRWVDGTVHAATSEGLARGLALASGGWERRHLVAALLGEPERAAALLAEADLDPGAEA